MTRLALALIGCVSSLASPATAEVRTGSLAADSLIATALKEQRILLTCSSLDPETHERFVANWLDDAAATLFILAENNVPTTAIAAFREAANVNALMPAPEATYAEVKSLCDAHPDWRDQHDVLAVTVLPISLPEAFAQ